LTRTIQDVEANVAALQTPLSMAERFSGGYWQTQPHHRVIWNEVERLLYTKDQDALIVKAGPRHGKSEFLSRWFPAWYLGHNPSRRVMLNTHTGSLAKFHSAWVRDKVHQLAPLFGLKGVDPMNSSATDWSIDGGGMGGMLAAGVGSGTVTGRGANLILIDDYLRNAADAQSETIRDKIWEWFTATISTRREPGGKLVLLCTQWHPDDLIGRLLSKRDEHGLNLRCITLQALREENGTKDPLRRQPGEALWPSRFPADVLEKQKKIMGAYWWSCQFQGKPINQDGQYFPDEYFSNVWCSDDEWPERFDVSAVFLDPSQGKDSKKGDYQALTFVGYKDGRYYVDSSIDRQPVPKLMRHMAAWCKEREPSFVGIEANAFQNLLAPHYIEACEEIGYWVTEPDLIDNTIGKHIRVQRLGGWLERRDLRFKKNASNEMLIQQAKNFPNGKHDDGPDSLEACLRLLCNSVASMNDLAEPEMSRLI
jgi:predicted phage terminase large subunit-like protein